MLYRWLADTIAMLHLGFVLFVVLGALLALRWPRIAWLHLPSAVWGVLIEWGGWVCPLTPLENRFRELAGRAGYRGGFVEHYLLPVLYPEGLTRGAQLILGGTVLAVNLVLYSVVLLRGRRRTVE